MSQAAEKKSIREEIEGVLELSTIPRTLKSVMDVVNDEDSSMGDLVRIIEGDPALASRVVAMANSAFYGYRAPVKSISKATMVLGYEMVRNLAITVSLFKCQNSREASMLKELWRHSFTVATASSLVAERTGIAKKGDAFLAGLVNDIGRVVLYQLYGIKYLELAKSGCKGLLLKEFERFGVTHPDAGAWFAEKNKFHEETVMAILHHHRPEAWLEDNSPVMELTPIVYIADRIASGNKEGFAYDLAESPRHGEILSSVYINDGDIAEIRTELQTLEKSIISYYSD